MDRDVSSDRSEHNTTRAATALRDWARGSLPAEAGVELLLRQGRLLILPPPEQQLDPERVVRHSLLGGQLSGGERRVRDIAASLLTGHPVDLADVMSGLDRRNLALVLAALAHTAGSHQDSRLVTADRAHLRVEPLAALVDWPSPDIREVGL